MKTPPNETPRHLQLTGPVALEGERAETAGRREIARRLYESALYLVRDGESASNASTLLRRIGRLYVEDGDFDAGVDCLDAAIAVADALGDASAAAYAKNVMAIAYWRQGHLDEAVAHFDCTLAAADEIGDAHLAAMAHQNVGVIASMRGDPESALKHFERALDGYRAAGHDEFLGTLMNNIGLAHAKLESWATADRVYLEALAHCATAGDVNTSLMIEANRAEVHIALGNLSEAARICNRVITRAGSLGDYRAVAEAQKHAGVIAREQGQVDDAEEWFSLALSGALDRNDLLLAAETAREQAELYTNLQRNRDTLQALITSHRYFRQLRAQQGVEDVSRRMRRLETRFLDLMRDWATSIESKDAYTIGHCERVSSYACVLAESLGFDETRLFWFRIGALLHDVGKISVPTEILNKAGPLTAEERIVMQGHARAGVELLRDIDFPWDILPMVRSHHERWDGAGYPDKLAGESIPLEARILCVADVFDALTSDRPYRRAMGRDQALAIMRADMGGFDPQVLGRFAMLVPLFPASLFSPERGAPPVTRQSSPDAPNLNLVA